MSKVGNLRAFINQRLGAAAEEIFELVEAKIAEYEGEMCRQHKLLDAVFNPEVRLHRADVQQLLVNEKEVPPVQQEWTPSLGQEDPPELPRFKDEQEELSTSEQGEQLLGFGEGTKLTFTPAPEKSEEDDDEKPQFLKLHQGQTEENRDAEHLKTEADGEDCGGSEPARNFNPDSYLQPVSHDEASLSSEPETNYSSCDLEKTRESQSGLNPHQNNEVPVSDEECNTGQPSNSSSECASSLGPKGPLQKRKGNQTRVKAFSCSICDKRYFWKNSLMSHMRIHSEGKIHSCPVCKKKFQRKQEVKMHMRSHTGERPFSCPHCGRGFAQSSTLKSHLKAHTGEKPFTCSVCKASFSLSGNLAKHMKLHTGEKPFSCSVCGKGFIERGHLRQHMYVHTGEKPFSCSVCDKKFTQRGSMRQHMTIHTGEQPFSCIVCKKRFSRVQILKKHKCRGESRRSK